MSNATRQTYSAQLFIHFIIGREKALEKGRDWNVRLYHKIMEWANLPETWQLGEEQRTPNAFKDACIQIDLPDDRVFTFHKTRLGNELVGKPKETWSVLCYDPKTDTQKSVNTNMDKASALMVAKRLSDENPEKIYNAAIIRDIIEKHIEVVPYKVFKDNETVGKLTE